MNRTFLTNPLSYHLRCKSKLETPAPQDHHGALGHDEEVRAFHLRRRRVGLPASCGALARHLRAAGEAEDLHGVDQLLDGLLKRSRSIH